MTPSQAILPLPPGEARGEGSPWGTKPRGHRPTRRAFCQALGAAAALAPAVVLAADKWQPRYVLASCMYGKNELARILPEVSKTGADAIDLWPAPHGNQREQVDELGREKFAEMLTHARVKLAIVTRFDLGPLKLTDEIRAASKLGAKMIVCGAVGPKGLAGAELKSAVAEFVKQLQPTLAVAAECGVTIGIENHDANLIESADSMRYLADLCAGKPLGVALAPYHMPQDPAAIAALVTDLGPRMAHFYAWQHGKGSRMKQPRADELMQLPGRGPLDFSPLMAALARIDYRGYTEIFMHPFPRGVPILDTPEEVTEEINRARSYLASVT